LTEYIIIGLLGTYSIVASYFCLKFAMIVLRVQDVIQTSLDVVDEKYERVDEILSRPLFYDSPEVRRVLEDIGDARDALQEVAIQLSGSLDKEEEVKLTNEG